MRSRLGICLAMVERGHCGNGDDWAMDRAIGMRLVGPNVRDNPVLTREGKIVLNALHEEAEGQEQALKAEQTLKAIADMHLDEGTNHAHLLAMCKSIARIALEQEDG